MSRVPRIRFKGFEEDWEQRKLGEVTTSYSGGTPNVSNCEYYGDEIPFIRSGEINNRHTDLFITEKGLLNSSAAMVKEGDILYALYGATSGEVSRSKLKGAINQAILAILPKTKYDSEYIAQWLKIKKRYIVDTYLQGGQGNLSGNIVKNFIVDFSSYNEQLNIGNLASSLDHLITLHQRKLEKLKIIKKSMLENLFPQNGEKAPKIRFSGFTKDWEQRKLSSIAEEITRTDPESTAPVMMITANNGFIEQSDRYAFNNAGKSLKKYILLEKGEMAYNHGASKLRSYGSCFALTTAESARIPFVYHCFSVGDNDPEFVSMELNGTRVENQLRKIVSSGARMDGLLNISYEEYASVELVMTCIPEQHILADYFRQLNHLITLHQSKFEKLQKIKKSMLESMFV